MRKIKSTDQRGTTSSTVYPALAKIDGSHSWQNAVPESFILYPVRELQEGEVLYFNFELAKEMGLIPESHARALNPELKKKLLETFSIRIINEYDQQNNVRYHPKVIKANKFMATRYLQLQHADKTGRTSGDGRGIWNGEVHHRGKTWDVSSRGTGVTALSPGAVAAGKPLQTGNTEHGYGCGLAELDELFAAAIMAEAFHHRGINTERMLCIIDLGNGYGIGVRAGLNLLRPAHFFCYLKQNNLEMLKKCFDYFIEREKRNGSKDLLLTGPKKYDALLSHIIDKFSQFTALLDREYIFAWLDWDGDNVLASAGIIDYGSIRQFGLRHDQYRYDDVERYSTNLNEQKVKAQGIIQTFCQAIEYVKSGEKPALESCNDHPGITEFKRLLEQRIYNRFLHQVGLSDRMIGDFKPNQKKLAEVIFQTFRRLESHKTFRKLRAVGDGVNRPAILNMRLGLIYLASCYQEGEKPKPIHFFNYVLCESARGKDKHMSYSLKKKIATFIDSYFQLFESLGVTPGQQTMQRAFERCSLANRPNRMTGDGLILVVEKLMNIKRHGRAPNELIQAVIDNLVQDQSPAEIIDPAETKHADRLKRITQDLRSIIDGHRESI